MKKPLTRILLLCALATATFGAALKPDDEKALVAAEKEWADATISKNIATLEKVLSDDLLWTHTNSKHDTKADLINGIKARKLAYASIKNENTRRQQYGNVVVANYDQHIRWPEGGSDNFVTFIWVKQGGNWRIVARHATVIPK